MAAITSPVQARLALHARMTLLAAAYCYRYLGIRIPHSWVTAVTNRSWSVRTGDGRWHRIRIDNRGRIL